ncbi:MAG: hypothetical protein FWD48_01330 [Oscillospiraceae bacterium]|nr:hypothetical protein [Oscillospiraceae bacterium]
MKKLTALFFAGIILFSACAAEIDGALTTPSPVGDTPPQEGNEQGINDNEFPSEEGWQTQSDGVVDEPPPPVTTTAPSARQTNEERYQQLAEQIAEAFVNKDIEFLSFQFADRSRKAFEFINDLDFIEFELIELRYNEESYEWIQTLNITVEDGTDDIFTLGGRDWELRLRFDENSAIRQFSPQGVEINELRRYSEGYLPFICYAFSADLNVFETMNDFNLIKDNFEYQDFSVKHSYLYRLSYFFNSIQRHLGNEERQWILTVDEVIEQAENMLGITNLDSSVMHQIGGHGWHWYYPAVVSEEITDTGAVIILDFYGDTGHLFVAKTMKYNLEFGDNGIRIVSTELLYSNDDLIMASGAI